GKIVSYEETDDGRYLIKLRGICRFRVSAEHALDARGFRTITPDWSPYHADLNPDTSGDTCREAIIQTLHAYFSKTGLLCDQWENMKQISCEKLISTLSVVCPLASDEKQTLLEAENLNARAKILQSLLEHAVRDT